MTEMFVEHLFIALYVVSLEATQSINLIMLEKVMKGLHFIYFMNIAAGDIIYDADLRGPCKLWKMPPLVPIFSHYGLFFCDQRSFGE